MDQTSDKKLHKLHQLGRNSNIHFFEQVHCSCSLGLPKKSLRLTTSQHHKEYKQAPGKCSTIRQANSEAVLFEVILSRFHQLQLMQEVETVWTLPQGSVLHCHAFRAQKTNREQRMEAQEPWPTSCLCFLRQVCTSHLCPQDHSAESLHE